MSNATWVNAINQYADTFEKPTKTPMLTELAAKAVHQWAESIQKPLSECPLPEELITLCQHSPTKAVLGIQAITFIVKMDKLIENEEKATKKRRLNV